MKLKIAVAITLIFSTVTVVAILLVNLYLQQTSQPKPDSQSQLPSYTQHQVASHHDPRDCWIIINNGVYNVTNFLSIHPGGAERIIPHCGQDATQAFATQGGEGQHSTSAQNQLESYQIGIVAGNK